MVIVTDQKGSTGRSLLVPSITNAIVSTRPRVIPISSFLRETGVLNKNRSIRISDSLKS